MKDLPDVLVSRWRRLDVPGREEARIERTTNGWSLTGSIEVEEAGTAARLAYHIDCDASWATRRAKISGSAAGKTVSFEFVSNGDRQWTVNGSSSPGLTGALDIDLGFTPATNMLPIRRLQLPVGQRTEVQTAWLRFPELRVERLNQTYERKAPYVFHYQALVDGELFEARLDTDEFGRVTRYEGLWEIESTTSSNVVPGTGVMAPLSSDVFFYGLFMDPAVLETKGIHGAMSRPGILRDWALRIGNRATLVPRPGSVAHGVVVEVALTDLDTLYAEASVRMYRPVGVLVDTGTTMTPALTYILPEPPAPEERNPEYAAKLQALAERLGFPKDYTSSIG